MDWCPKRLRAKPEGLQYHVYNREGALYCAAVAGCTARFRFNSSGAKTRDSKGNALSWQPTDVRLVVGKREEPEQMDTHSKDPSCSAYLISPSDPRLAANQFLLAAFLPLEPIRWRFKRRHLPLSWPTICMSYSHCKRIGAVACVGRLAQRSQHCRTFSISTETSCIRPEAKPS